MLSFRIYVNLIILLIASSVTMADDFQIVQKILFEPIKHPGKYELIYMEQIDRRPPLAPIQKVKAHYKYFYVYPGVTAPSVQSVYLLEFIDVKQGDTVLDLGTGSGIQAIFAAEKASKVVATDLDASSVENAAFNVKGHNVQSIVETRQGDLFGPVRSDETFNVIINNIDYPYDEKSQGLWKVHERFFREVKNYMKPDATIYYQSGLIDNIPRIHQLVKENGLRIMHMHMNSIYEHGREPIVYIIKQDPLLTTVQQ